MSKKDFKGSRRFVEFETNKIRENFDWAETVRHQIDRCLIAAGFDDISLSGNIEGLETLLPEELIDEQYELDLELSSQDTEKWIVKLYCGQRLGSKEDPYVWDSSYNNMGKSSEPGFEVLKLEDDSIDWGDPRIISPTLTIIEKIDWRARFNAVFNQFVRLGIAARRNLRG